MISNPENTLQTLDTLVVQNNNNDKSFAGESSDRKTKPYSTSPLFESTNTKSSRPKMIHTSSTTQKLKRKQQHLITKPATELTDQMDLFSIHKSDFDVINPDPVLPTQISCSPIRGARRDSFTESDVDVEFEQQPPIAEAADQRRSNRLRRSTVPNRKYLEFETNLTFGRNGYKNSSSATNNKNGSSSGTSSKKKRDNEFECEMCSKSFCDENELLTHVSVHI